MDYNEWLNKLRVLAKDSGIELSEDKYHYHTYYMRGYLPEGVIEDLKAGK